MKRLPLFALFVVAAAPALAQYKMVSPDGSVTYTDRPPPSSTAKITALTRRAGAPLAADADLPFELRQVAARYPVTLFTSADCPPCDSGRQLLQQRGVPFTERVVSTNDDANALEKAVGGRTVPSLLVGSQALRGLLQTDWMAYLDAAGYPKESRLPRNWQAPAATPLTERPVARSAAAPAAPAAPSATETETPPPADSNIKF